MHHALPEARIYCVDQGKALIHTTKISKPRPTRSAVLTFWGIRLLGGKSILKRKHKKQSACFMSKKRLHDRVASGVLRPIQLLIRMVQQHERGKLKIVLLHTMHAKAASQPD